jgi:cytidylate kinase
MTTRLDLIALDGPSGAGKSSAAKRVAEALGWAYLDTGAMFRATALALLRAGASLEDDVAVRAVLDGLSLGQVGTTILLNGEDVSDAIRTPEITKFVTPVSQDPRVRKVLLDQQRAVGAQGGFVVDGRDIGTVVFPGAALKVFLTASVEARARRRFLEQQAKGIEMSFDEVAADIARRDHADSTRAEAPLRKADDALELDSSGMTLDQVVARIVALWREQKS